LHQSWMSAADAEGNLLSLRARVVIGRLGASPQGFCLGMVLVTPF